MLIKLDINVVVEMAIWMFACMLAVFVTKNGKDLYFLLRGKETNEMNMELQDLF